MRDAWLDVRNNAAVLATTVDASLRGDMRLRAVAAAAAAATALQASQLRDESVLWEEGALLPPQAPAPPQAPSASMTAPLPSGAMFAPGGRPPAASPPPTPSLTASASFVGGFPAIHTRLDSPAATTGGPMALASPSSRGGGGGGFRTASQQQLPTPGSPVGRFTFPGAGAAAAASAGAMAVVSRVVSSNPALRLLDFPTFVEVVARAACFIFPEQARRRGRGGSFPNVLSALRHCLRLRRCSPRRVQIAAYRRRDGSPLPDVTASEFFGREPWLPANAAEVKAAAAADAVAENAGPLAFLILRLQALFGSLTPEAAAAAAASAAAASAFFRPGLQTTDLASARSGPQSPAAFRGTLLPATARSSPSLPLPQLGGGRSSQALPGGAPQSSAAAVPAASRLLLGMLETAPRGEVFSRTAVAQSVVPGAAASAALSSAALGVAASLRSLLLTVSSESPFKALGLSALMPVPAALPPRAGGGGGGGGKKGGGKTSEKDPILAPIAFSATQEAQRVAFRAQQSAAAAVSGLLAPPDPRQAHLRTRLFLNVDAPVLQVRPGLAAVVVGGYYHVRGVPLQARGPADLPDLDNPDAAAAKKPAKKDAKAKGGQEEEWGEGRAGRPGRCG